MTGGTCGWQGGPAAGNPSRGQPERGGVDWRAAPFSAASAASYGRGAAIFGRVAPPCSCKAATCPRRGRASAGRAFLV